MGKDKKEGINKELQELNKKLKGALLVSADEVNLPFYERLPTGIPSLDLSLGGGWPRGTVSVISGPPASGKDFIANSSIAQVQQLFSNESKITIATLGYGFDRMFMRYAGVRIPLSAKEKASLSKEEQKLYNEKLGEIFFLQPAASIEHRTAEVLEAIAEIVGTNTMHLIVLNELGMDEPKEAAARKLKETRKPGASAALFSQFARRLTSNYVATSDAENPNKTTVLLLSQVRANYGNPYVTTTSVGGYAIKHLIAIELGLQIRGSLKDTAGNLIGHTVKYRLIKGKYGTHDGVSGEYNFYFDTGVDVMEDTISVLTAQGFIKQNGPWYTFEQFDIRAKGLVALKEALQPKFKEVHKWVYTSIISQNSST
jgi:recombination protein RecA